MQPKTRLDRLVTIRERSEESALENLARARSSLDHAARRLVGLRQGARADGRIDAPDLFLAGLGLKRKGGVRRK